MLGKIGVPAERWLANIAPVSGGNGRLIADRYELVTLLGHGGMGYVWQAHDLVLDRDVAVKEVFVPDPGGEQNRRAFREARAAARLNHPGIVTIHDLVIADGRSWIVMELVRGRSLDDTLREDGPLPPYRVTQIGLEMLRALRTAHDAGILHRDIKPANVLLTPGGAVITDFGIAIIQGEENLTGTGQVIGTPTYMAPERMRGEPASRASDMWSLGATLYAALTGHPPGGPGTAVEAGALAPVIEGLLRPDPRARLTAEQAGEMLGRLMSGPGPRPTALDQPGRPTRILPSRPGLRPGLRSRRVAAAAALLVAVAAAVTLTMALSGGSPAGARTASGAGIPPGYKLYTDSARHFSAAIPDGWLASTEDGLRMFCAPAGCSAVIAVEPVSGSDPVADIRNYPLANGHVPASEYSSYHRLRMGPVSYGARAAEVEFTIRERGFPVDIEGLVRLFTVTNGGQEYYVQVTAPSTNWRKALPVLAVFFATFSGN
jgi:hypothetical protein